MHPEPQLNPPPTIGRASVEAQDLARHLATATMGQVITYAELNAAAKCDVQQRNTVLQTARRQMMHDPHRMVFGTISNVGIKRLEDHEISDEGMSCVKRARRIARNGLKKLACADLSKLDQESKIRLHTSRTVLWLLTTSGNSKTIGLAEQSARRNDGELKIGDISTLFSK